MSIKYKNEEALNERKSNQSGMNLNLTKPKIEDQLTERKFGLKDQEEVEQNSGDGGETNGESFDKNIRQSNKSK